jgi:site-specific DNA-methyltransferase (adenine-specific)
MANELYYGDNLSVLRESIPDESVDLIYLDPPFNSNASYNVLFRAPSGEQSQAQIEAFEDSWHWNTHAEQAFDEIMKSGNTDAAELLRSMRGFLGENDMMAYLAMMAVRLIELHRVLKPTGSLYLHCDPTASHYLKTLLDAIFRPHNFLNEIIWKRTHAHGSSKRYGPIHDVILFYAKSDKFIWTNPRSEHDPSYVAKHFKSIDERNGQVFQAITLTGSGIRKGESGRPWKGIDPTNVGRHWALPGAIVEELEIKEGTVQQRLDALEAAGRIYWPKTEDGTPRLKWFVSDLRGMAIPDVWTDIAPISAQAKERLGYPTQKPVALLERIISSSSLDGAVVLDPFCGCGTTIHAAQKLGRRWIGIDITHLAIGLIERRLRDAFPGIKYKVEGTPKDFAAAEDLAKRDPFQFQWWAVTLINAVPYGGKKKGADSGIDGLYYCKPDGKTTKLGIVSVKGGDSLHRNSVGELRGVLERDNALLGVLITLRNPTGPMKVEAASAGFFETPFGKFPRIQIATVDDLLAGKLPRLPPQEIGVGYRQAPLEGHAQEKLL